MPISTEDSGMPTTRPKTGSLSRVSRQEESVEGGGGTIYIPVSTEGSGMPTMRPETGYPIRGLRAGLFSDSYNS